MCNPFYTTAQFTEHWLHLKPRTVTVYMQTSAFSFYLQNHINNYKQTTENTVCVNCDYPTGYNTAVIQFFVATSQQFYDLLRHNLLCTASST